MSSATAHRLIHDIVSTADLFLRESTRLFRPHGLSAAQFNVLNVIGLRGDGVGLSQRELADTLVVDRSNVTGMIDRMEIAGWVRRADDPSDRRVYRVLLTPAGKKLWQKVGPGYADVVAQVTARLAEKQMQDTVNLLGILQEDAVRWVPPKL